MSNGLFTEVDPLRERIHDGRRSPIDMACDILGVLSEGQTKPTRILQKANMNWIVLRSQLEYLSSRGMIEEVAARGQHVEYKLTAKGESILQLYIGLKSSLTGLANAHPTSSDHTEVLVVEQE